MVGKRCYALIEFVFFRMSFADDCNDCIVAKMMLKHLLIFIDDTQCHVFCSLISLLVYSTTKFWGHLWF